MSNNEDNKITNVELNLKNAKSDIKYKKILCFACKKEIEFDDSGFAIGMKYEVRCPNCRSYIMMRKVS